MKRSTLNKYQKVSKINSTAYAIIKDAKPIEIKYQFISNTKYYDIKTAILRYDFCLACCVNFGVKIL